MAEHHVESSSKPSANSGSESGVVKVVKFMTDVGLEQVKPALIETLPKIAPAIVTSFGIPVEEGGGHSAAKPH